MRQAGNNAVIKNRYLCIEVEFSPSNPLPTPRTRVWGLSFMEFVMWFLIFQVLALCCFGYAGFAQPIWNYTELSRDQQTGGQFPSLKVGGDKVHTAFWEPRSNTLYYASRARNTNPKATWNQEVVFIGGGWRNAMVIDSSGTPHIAFLANVNGYARIRYATKVNQQWRIETVSERDLGGYEPALQFALSYVQPSVDITLLPNGQPFIVYFDGTFPLQQCTNRVEDYGCELWRSTKTPAGWVSSSFGDLPAWDTGDFTVNRCEGIAGARYGEFCRIITRPDKRLTIFTVAKINGYILQLNQFNPDVMKDWQITAIDTNYRIYKNKSDAEARSLTFDGLSALITPDNLMHVFYNLSTFYGRSTAGIPPGFYGSNYMFVLSHAITTVDSVLQTKTFFPVERRLQKGQFLSYTDCAAIGKDTLLLTVCDRESSQYLLLRSYNRGVNWRVDTLLKTLAPQSQAPIVYDPSLKRLHTLLYETQSQRLHYKQLSLDSVNIDVFSQLLTVNEQSGNPLFTTYFIQNRDTIFYAFYRKIPSDSLFLTSINNNKINTTNFIAAGSGVRPLSVETTRNGQYRLLYNRGNVLALHTGNGSRTFGPAVSFAATTLVEQAGQDTLHALYYEPNGENLYHRTVINGTLIGEENIIQADGSGEYVTLIKDNNQNIHTIYRGANGKKIWYQRRTGHGFSQPVAIDQATTETDDLGYFCALIADSLNDLHAVHLNRGEMVMHYLHQKNGIWQVPTQIRLSNRDNPGHFSLLRRGNNNTLWLLYTAEGLVPELNLLRLDKIGWQPYAILHNQTPRIARNVGFHVIGQKRVIIGRQTAPQLPGLGMLTNDREVILFNDRPDPTENTIPVIYPNPAQDQLFVTLPLINSPTASVRIISLTGACVLYQPLTAGLNQLNLESIPAGIYWVEIFDGKNYFWSKLSHTR